MVEATVRWWLPGVLIGAVGVCAVAVGLATGGPDVVGGVVFGGVALAAAAVILRRRVPRPGGPSPRDEDAEPGAAADGPKAGRR